MIASSSASSRRPAAGGSYRLRGQQVVAGHRRRRGRAGAARRPPARLARAPSSASSAGSGSWREPGTASRGRMPAPITWRSWRSMIRPSARSLSRGSSRPRRRRGRRCASADSSANTSTGRSAARRTSSSRTSLGSAARRTVTSRIRVRRHVRAPRVEDPTHVAGGAANPAAGGSTSSGSRTPATNSVQLAEAPMTDRLLPRGDERATQVVARRRPTKTRCPSSPRRPVRPARGRYRPSSSSEITTRSRRTPRPWPSSRSKRVRPSAASAARYPLAEEVDGRPPLCVLASRVEDAVAARSSAALGAGGLDRGHAASWADRCAGRRQPCPSLHPHDSSVLRVPAPSMRPVLTLVRADDAFRPAGGPPDGGPPIEHTLRPTAAHGRPFVACVHPWARDHSPEEHRR